MSVDAATVRRIAHLSRIAVADGEVEHLRGELNAILAFVEQLSEVNVDGVEPMTSVTPMVKVSSRVSPTESVTRTVIWCEVAVSKSSGPVTSSSVPLIAKRPPASSRSW